MFPRTRNPISICSGDADLKRKAYASDAFGGLSARFGGIGRMDIPSIDLILLGGEDSGVAARFCAYHRLALVVTEVYSQFG